MKNETVAIAGKGKRYIEHCGIVQRLLDAITDRMFVVFGFNYCQRYARFEIQHVVCTADAAFVACSFLSSHNYPAGSQIDLFAHLALSMPASRSNRRGDKFGADVSFAELFFVHAWSLCLREQAMTRAGRRPFIIDSRIYLRCRAWTMGIFLVGVFLSANSCHYLIQIADPFV
jgi:hypothetical protein